MRVVIWIFLGSVVILLAVVIVALLRSKVDPIAWQPGPNPGLTGLFAPNEAIAGASLLLEGVGVGPEDIAVSPDGWMYTGYRDGRIVRFDKGGRHEEFVNTGGFPLGMRVDKVGNLIVADAARGLLSVSPDGAIEVLASSVDGEPMKFVDGIDIAADGTIWFTDASTRFSNNDSIYIFVEGSATGRLLSYSRDTGEVRVRLDGLFFANGVAVAPGDDFVLVSETAGGRVRRLWLKGERAGSDDLFIDGLPGAPDNLSVDDQGIFWIGIAGLRDPKFEKLADKPLIRRMLGALPRSALTPAGRHNMLLGIDGNGAVRHNLQSSNGPFVTTTAATRVDGRLYICSLGSDSIGVIDLP